MKKRKQNNTGYALASAAAIFLFAVVLWVAISSIGAVGGGIKRASAAPDSLLSAGAPRSQLELKRFFESIGLTYTEDGKKVWEPVSSEYRRAVERLSESGDRQLLSVEEVLFIISDSRTAYDSFDVIRFRSGSGEVEEEILPVSPTEDVNGPYHRSASDRVALVNRVIMLRMKSLSSEDSFVSLGNEIVYTPENATPRDDGGIRSFVFGGVTDSPHIPVGVMFSPGDGRRVLLYPTEEDLAETKTKVLLQTKVPASDDERELLASVGCDPDRCRNITPEYWYGRTGLRLFVFGGRAVLVDPELGRGVLLLPEAYSLMSAAICGEAGDMSFYFTAAYDGEFSLWKYRDGEVMRLVVSETDCLAVTEPFEGGYEKVGLYNAVAREDERFVVALECIGERLCEYTAD